MGSGEVGSGRKREIGSPHPGPLPRGAGEGGRVAPPLTRAVRRGGEEDAGGGFAGGFGVGVRVSEVAEGGEGGGAGFGLFEAAAGFGDELDGGEGFLRLGRTQERGDLGEAQVELIGDVHDGEDGVLEGSEEGI